LSHTHSLVLFSPLFPYTTLFRSSTEPMPAPIDTDNRGKDGNDDDYGDDVMNALTNIRNGAAQGESAENHGADPKNPAKNIERQIDRKSTRLNSSHRTISYAVFCL